MGRSSGVDKSLKKAPFRGPHGMFPFQGYTLIVMSDEGGAPVRMGVPKFFLALCLFIAFAGAGGVAALAINYAKMRSFLPDYERLKTENTNLRAEASALAERLLVVQNTLNQVDTFSNQLRQAAQMDPSPGVGAKLKIDTFGFHGSDRKNPSPAPSGVAAPSSPPAVGPAVPNQGFDIHSTVESPVQTSAGIGPLSREEYRLYQAGQRKALAQQTAPGLGLQEGSVSSQVKFEQLEFRELFSSLDRIEKRSASQARNMAVFIKELQAYRERIARTPTISPVQGYFSSLYGWRQSPMDGNQRFHQGVDIAAPMGSDIRVAAGGVVIRVGDAEDYGKYVEVSHGHGIVTRYAHASAILTVFGAKVKKGDLIARVGQTGRTTGPHLHYEIEVNGKRVDPSSFIQGL